MVALFDSMNNPKIYISALLASVAFLYLLLQFMPDQRNGYEHRAVVLSNTLTQSLDGHRRYLTVVINNRDIFRVNAPPTEDCLKGSTAIVSTQSSSINEGSHFNLVKCFDAEANADNHLDESSTD